MTREEGIQALRARKDGELYRWLEMLKNGKLVSVVLERVDKPAWRLIGRTWSDVIRSLE